MNLRSWTRCLFLLAGAALTACGGGAPVPAADGNSAVQQPYGTHLPAPSAQMIAATTAQRIVPHVKRNHKKSWIAPDAKNTQYLLYVSDEAAGAVDVYAYKSQKGHLVGQLTGFQFPYGECQDNSGNVYVTDFGSNDIVEYAHGGASPIKTLKDAYGYPIGCSVNPTNGDLAVANYEAAGSNCMGGVVIYADATGSGTNYQDSDFVYFYPPGYDPSGNLYVQGQASNGSSGIAELGATSSTLTTLSLAGGTIYFPGGMQWDGKYMNATDQEYEGGTTSAVYQISVSGLNASIVGTVQLTDECYKGSVAYNDTVQPFLNGTARPFHAIVGGNLACDNRYDFWNYIRGGDPKRNLPGSIAPLLASGQVVSAMKR